jgi:hypothetical protein
MTGCTHYKFRAAASDTGYIRYRVEFHDARKDVPEHFLEAGFDVGVGIVSNVIPAAPAVVTSTELTSGGI